MPDISREERQYMTENGLEVSPGSLYMVIGLVLLMVAAIIWWVWSVASA